ncbi:adenylyl-sulfate kinase [soil metagenome]
MIFIQFTGLSGAGKSTIAQHAKLLLEKAGHKVEVIDADVYRPVLCPDLGYSTKDRMENIRRLGFVGNLLAKNGVIAILAAINPYESIRREIVANGGIVKTVWINCDLDTLMKRDTKGLYGKAQLPDGHSDKIYNLTGVNDIYEPPLKPDLIINTQSEDIDTSVKKVVDFINIEIAGVAFSP